MELIPDPLQRLRFHDARCLIEEAHNPEDCRRRLCRTCKGELTRDGDHLHEDDAELHREMDEHQAHGKDATGKGRWQPSSCSLCIDILDRASRNHREQAGEGQEHTDIECIEAYSRYAERMSAS